MDDSNGQGDAASGTDNSSQTLGNGPVGSGAYTVKQGDCMTSIAHAFGFFWQTLWDDPGNAELKRIRKDPNILFPGDLVTIPPKTLRVENKSTEQRHMFVLKGEPARLRLKVMMTDNFQPVDSANDSDSGNDQDPPPVLPEPRANQPYILVLSTTGGPGVTLTGTTDGDGMIDVGIPPGTATGKLTIGPDNMVIPLQFGAVDPLNQLSGVQGRLNNLGFNCGPADGAERESTSAALAYFQKMYGLDQSGEPDAATLDKLKEIHGS